MVIESFRKRLLTLNPTVIIQHHKQHLQRMAQQLDQGMVKWLQYRKRELVGLVSHLKSVDPKNLLKKGYAILFEENTRSVITNAAHLAVGTKIVARLSDGEARLLVEETILSER